MSALRNVVVTGAGDPIGRALAAGFAADGFRVVGTGADSGALDRTAALCPPGGFRGLRLDIADERAVAAAFQDIEGERGPVDILVAAENIYARQYFLDEPAADWNRTILVTLCGVANACRAVLPGMLDRNAGRIVVIGSLADTRRMPATSAYAAARGGQHALVRALAAEIDRRHYPGVLVNELVPGTVPAVSGAMVDDTATVYRHVRRLVDLPAGGPTGRLFLRDREIRPRVGLKAALRRLVLGR